MRVLISDGDSEFLDIAMRFMNQCGHVALVASNGLECIACLRDCPPDVLVLTCSLLWGGHDGVLAVMDVEPTLDSIPVILVTDEELESQTVFNAGSRVVARVRKPYSLTQLLKHMQLCELHRPRSLV